MMVNALRASTINSYKDCEWRYYLQYLLGFEEPGNKKAHLGTICHHVWEILARAKKCNYKGRKYIDPEYLLKICWARYVKKLPLFDFTEEDFEKCTKLIATICNSKLNPLNLNVLSVEHQFEIEIDKLGFRYDEHNPITETNVSGNLLLRGTMDLITKVDDETIELLDWKTGDRKDWITGAPKELDGFYKDQQLRIYDFALKHLFPQYKYRLLTVVYVRDGGPFTVTFDDEDRKQTFQDLRKDFNIIRKNFNPSRLKDDYSRSSSKWKCRYVCGFGDKYKTGKVCKCDDLYNKFQAMPYDEATQELYQLSIKGKSDDSRRNDYNRASIHKITIGPNDTI